MTNHTDKELLMLAARAAGVEIPLLTDWTSYDDANGFNWMKDGFIESSFNPLNDDGDALRLAVILDLQRVFAGGCEHGSFCYMEPFNGDPHAATRRAIVRAAAAIGGKL